MSVKAGRLALAKRAVAEIEKANAGPALTLEHSEPSSAPRRRVVIMDDTEIAELGTPAQLIDGVLPANGLVLLIGEKGSLKTFLALDWSAHVSLGLPDWHGHAVMRGPVVYVYAEGRTGILPRVEAWKAYHRTGNLGILFVPHRVVLNEPGVVLELLEAINERLPEEPPALVVVDTLNRNFAGNENSAEDMSAFVRGCDTIREETGATVLVVHHKGHGEADRGRGSSVLDAAADAIVFVTRDEDRLTLKNPKMKDGAEFAPLAMEALSVGGSLVLKPTGHATGQLKGQRLQCLRVLCESSEKGLTSKAWQEATGIANRSSFSLARDYLNANSYVTPDAGRWKPTDAGRLSLKALTSSPSSGTSSQKTGHGQDVHQRGGV